MKLMYRFDENQNMTGLWLSGLDGCEGVASAKDALKLMRIQNPLINFVTDAKNGAYDHLTDEEFAKVKDTIKWLGELWHHRGETTLASDINPIALLLNAIDTINTLNNNMTPF